MRGGLAAKGAVLDRVGKMMTSCWWSAVLMLGVGAACVCGYENLALEAASSDALDPCVQHNSCQRCYGGEAKTKGCSWCQLFEKFEEQTPTALLLGGCFKTTDCKNKELGTMDDLLTVKKFHLTAYVGLTKEAECPIPPTGGEYITDKAVAVYPTCPRCAGAVSNSTLSDADIPVMGWCQRTTVWSNGSSKATTHGGACFGDLGNCKSSKEDGITTTAYKWTDPSMCSAYGASGSYLVLALTSILATLYPTVAH